MLQPWLVIAGLWIGLTIWLCAGGAATLTAQQPPPAETSIRGTVTVDGQPAQGLILFFLPDDQIIGAKVGDDGKYHVKRIPLGEATVVFQGARVAAKFSSEETSGLRVQTEAGANEINFDLTSR